MLNPLEKFFERCPRCLRGGWALFPVFRCPNCETYLCGCCDLPELPDDDVHWLAAALAEPEKRTCPACTGRITRHDRVGQIRRRAGAV